jgi:hypothetical protein
VHIDGVAKSQRRKGRPLPTRHASCRGVFGMILIGVFFLLAGAQVISAFDNWTSGLMTMALGACLIYGGYLREK